jgi:hypothetical protein
LLVLLDFCLSGVLAFRAPPDAARMLSTRLGYDRPARFAARLAAAFFAGVNLRCRVPFGAAFFHGAFFAPRLAEFLRVELVMG